jgi:hypothetical protein
VKLKNKGIVFVIIMCLIIVSYGFVVVSGRLPKFIKDKSYFKIDYSIKPFDFTMDINDYSFYINEKIINSAKNNSINLVDDVKNASIRLVSNTQNTSTKLINNIEHVVSNGGYNIANKTIEVYKSVEYTINGIVKNKF